MIMSERKRSQIDWKRGLKIGLGVILGIIVMRLLIFTLFFSEFMKLFTNFNTNFESSQQSIHNKIESSRQESRQEIESYEREHLKNQLELEEKIARDDQIRHEALYKERALQEEMDNQKLEKVQSDWNQIIADRDVNDQRILNKIEYQTSHNDKKRESERLRNFMSIIRPSIECEKKVFGKTTFNPQCPELYSQQGIEDHFEICKKYRKRKNA